MNFKKIFPALLLLVCSCQKEEEEVVDLDHMALLEEEFDDSHLVGEPQASPQEILFKEPMNPSH